MRLLLVEDDSVQRGLLALRLAAAGLTVDQAADGLEAYDSLRRSTPDALLLDLEMPKLGGFGLLERLGKEGIRLPRSIVLFSARRPSADDEVRARELGAKALLPKPIGLNELLALVGVATRPSALRDRQ